MTPPASGNWEYTMKLWAVLDRIAKVATAAAVTLSLSACMLTSYRLLGFYSCSENDCY